MPGDVTTTSSILRGHADRLEAQAGDLGLVVTPLPDGTRTVSGSRDALDLWRRAESLRIAADTMAEAGL